MGSPFLLYTIDGACIRVPENELKFPKHIVPVEEALSNIGKVEPIPEKVKKNQKSC